MTASEAREAAAVVRALAEHGYASGSGVCVSWADLPPSIDDIDEAIQNAAVALEAYADGIDAAAREREACAAICAAAAAQAETPRLRALGPEMVPFDAARVTLADQLARAIRARGAK